MSLWNSNFTMSNKSNYPGFTLEQKYDCTEQRNIVTILNIKLIFPMVQRDILSLQKPFPLLSSLQKQSEMTRQLLCLPVMQRCKRSLKNCLPKISTSHSHTILPSDKFPHECAAPSSILNNLRLGPTLLVSYFTIFNDIINRTLSKMMKPICSA